MYIIAGLGNPGSKYENVIVISDDINLAPGKMRIRRKGGAGGHNGLKSIIECMGTDNFPRIRLGIGGKTHPDMDLADYVLGKFPKSEQEDIDRALKNAAKAAELIIAGDVNEAMNQFN